MTQYIILKVFPKYVQSLKMDTIPIQKEEYVEMKVPEFLNSEEKYNKMIHNTDTMEKFEDIFTKLLTDDEMTLPEILKLMKCIERDIILVHGIDEITQLLEMTYAFINYMMAVAEITKNKTKSKSSDEGVFVCDCDC